MLNKILKLVKHANMNTYINISFISFKSTLFILVAFLVCCFTANARPSTSYLQCESCKGSMTSITFRYVGTAAVAVEIKDKKEVYFDKPVAMHQTITITGTKNNGTFEDKELDLFVNNIAHASLDVDCSDPIYVGLKVGDFVIIAGESRLGGALCCSNTTDNTKPTFSNCPTTIEMALAANECMKQVSWIPPTATDDCLVDKITTTHAPGVNFIAGTTIVTYTAVDLNGNKSTCSFNIIVRDATSPEVSCPENIVIAVKDNEKSAVVNWSAPRASDNCDGLVLTASHKPGDLFPIGTTRVTYTANDRSNNMVTCDFTVVVEPPGIQDLVVIGKFFTPDGDGYNDIWTIENIENYKTNAVTVVDRWGGVVFEATGYNNRSNAWDGRDKGLKTLPAGTYFYSIQINNKMAKGFIELIR